MRKCKSCGKLLPETDFYHHVGYADGLDTKCKECQKEYQRKYRSENKELVKERSSAARKRDREKIRARNREFYAKTKNDPYYIQKRKETYDRNKHKYHEKDREKRKSFNEKWKRPCEKCGEERLYLIQFHHIDPSKKCFCIGANACLRSESVLTEEVAKCVCLCSNCHDEFHYLYGQKPKFPAEALYEYLKEDKAE